MDKTKGSIEERVEILEKQRKYFIVKAGINSKIVKNLTEKIKNLK